MYKLEELKRLRVTKHTVNSPFMEELLKWNFTAQNIFLQLSGLGWIKDRYILIPKLLLLLELGCCFTAVLATAVPRLCKTLLQTHRSLPVLHIVTQSCSFHQSYKFEVKAN